MKIQLSIDGCAAEGLDIPDPQLEALAVKWQGQMASLGVKHKGCPVMTTRIHIHHQDPKHAFRDFVVITYGDQYLRVYRDFTVVTDDM